MHVWSLIPSRAVVALVVLLSTFYMCRTSSHCSGLLLKEGSLSGCVRAIPAQLRCQCYTTVLRADRSVLISKDRSRSTSRTYEFWFFYCSSTIIYRPNIYTGGWCVFFLGFTSTCGRVKYARTKYLLKDNIEIPRWQRCKSAGVLLATVPNNQPTVNGVC